MLINICFSRCTRESNSFLYSFNFELGPFGRTLLFDGSTVEHQDERVLLLQRADVLKFTKETIEQLQCTISFHSM